MNHENSTPPASSNDIESTTIDRSIADSINVQSLIAKETVLPFCGVTPQEDTSYPESIHPDSRFRTSEDRTFKEALQALPDATRRTLYHENAFVDDDGTPDLSAIKSEAGFTEEDFEQLDIDIDDRATQARGRLDRVEDHVDIVDPRREALAALGFGVKYRWQVASSSYAIIQPKDTLMRAIGTLQRNGYTDVYGAVSLRDWGGEATVYLFFPSRALDFEDAVSEPDDVPGLADLVETVDESDKLMDAGDIDDLGVEDFGSADQLVHMGLKAVYSHTGSATFRVTECAYAPEDDVLFHYLGNNVEKRRSHRGTPNDDEHERKNDRTPLSKWWEEGLRALELQDSTLPRIVARARRTPLDFRSAPYSVEEFYEHLGIPSKYAEAAADYARSFGMTPHVMTIWTLGFSLKVILSQEFGGATGSQRHEALYKKAFNILEAPAQTIESVRQDQELSEVDDPLNLPDSHLTNIDTVEDLKDLPELMNGLDLSDVEAVETTKMVTTSLEEFA